MTGNGNDGVVVEIEVASALPPMSADEAATAVERWLRHQRRA